MRLLFASPRYGADISGGAEQAVRELALRLRERGHDVHVLSVCARSYVDWSDFYPPGDSVVEGIQVHRFRVDKRPIRGAAPGESPVPVYWRTTPWALAGYPMTGAGIWLQRHAGDYDVVIPYTYQHHTTWESVMLSAAPTVLHPAAHPEPALNASALDLLFHRVATVSVQTPEERDLIRWRFGLDDSRLALSGMGVAALSTTDAEVRAFRSSFGLGDAPYIVCVGRTDPAKGAPALVRQFVAWKERRPGALRLVVVGEQVQVIAPHPDVVATGFVPAATRNAAVAGAELLVQPSPYESFSFVVAEAWLLGVPVLVQGESAVLRGQVARSGGGLAYVGASQLEAHLDRLLGDAPLRRRMARAGAGYIAEHCDWGRFLDRYEQLLGDVVERWGHWRSSTIDGLRRSAACPTT
jgi:glycosyltransferase involved in cell wall biosynthesis